MGISCKSGTLVKISSIEECKKWDSWQVWLLKYIYYPAELLCGHVVSVSRGVQASEVRLYIIYTLNMQSK